MKVCREAENNTGEQTPTSGQAGGKEKRKKERKRKGNVYVEATTGIPNLLRSVIDMLDNDVDD
jgi:hypothetical protein